MSRHDVKFYFDYGSPYSYIASRRIEQVCEANGADLHWMPMVIGGLFQSNETTPPHAFPNRARYLAEDLKDLTAYHGIPYRQRTVFLFKPILSLRATLAVPQGSERGKAVHALFHGAWAEDLDLGEAEVVAGLLTKAGLDGKALVERTQEDAIKGELRENTDDAVSRGFFGAPTMLVDDTKMFWGQDRLDLLAHYLNSH